MMSANIPTNLRKIVYARDGYRCALCDSTKGLQIHHYISRSDGGSNHPHNLICLCWKCHAVAHGTKIPDYPDHIDAAYIQQACVEYLADLYCINNWYPFGDS